MSSEEDTKILLQLRENLEKKLMSLQTEMEDIKKLIFEIDREIVSQGFKRPSPQSSNIQLYEEKTSNGDHGSYSIIAKNGILLGKMDIENNEIVFLPNEDYQFSIETPPFQSFLIDRVLRNMKQIDSERASNGEISSEQILDFEIQTEGDILKEIIVKNYRDERRLREIQSSLRWTLDKMYDKIRRG